jgi:hypothetical protein
MNLGKPQKRLTVEPVTEPAPAPTPAPEPPAPAPLETDRRS